jgi:hypothetical protein
MPDEREHRVEGIEQEVRLQLRLDRLEFGFARDNLELPFPLLAELLPFE